VGLAVAADTSWTLAPGPIALAAVLGVLYVRRWGRVRRAPGARTAGAGRLLAFAAGLTVLLLALVSPLDRLGEQLFAMHMVQHVLILDLVPILLMLGLTKTLLRPVTRRVQVLEQRAGFLAHPAFAVVLYVATMAFWHIPAMYDLALENATVHVVEHLTFLNAGLLYWWHLLSPIRGRISIGPFGPGRLHARDEALRVVHRDRDHVRARRPLRLLRDGPRVWGLSAPRTRRWPGRSWPWSSRSSWASRWPTSSSGRSGRARRRTSVPSATGRPDPTPGGVAFVLGGGGGPLGAHEVGMLRALAERQVVPDLVLGTSIGAINGAAFAADPTLAGVERLVGLWTALDRDAVFGGSALRRAATLARTRTHLHDGSGLRGLLTELLPVATIEELPVAFACVAASIEQAREQWFAEGSLVDAVMASCAVPGMLPPVAIGAEHFIDGGIVNSIPVGHAVALGARTVHVLHVGRLDRPLEPPRWPWEVGLVAFEVARRHRFLGDLAALPDGVEVHVLATGQEEPPRFSDLRQYRYRDTTRIPIASPARTRPRWPTSRPTGSARLMRVPPTPVRRLLVTPVVLAVDAVLVAASPALALLAALASPVTGGRRPLRVLAITVVFAARHLAATLACFGLWVAAGGGRRLDTPRMQRAHYAVLGWFVAGVHGSLRRAARVAVGVVDSDEALEVLSARQRPVVVLSRHAGEGDSLVVLHHLLCGHGRRPRVVLHEALRLDPLIDVLGRRLPNRFVDPRGGDTEVEIAAMAKHLGPEDAVLIFPEGGNFTPARRDRGIARLRKLGHHEQAGWAEDMEHVAAPRPGGALAALEAAPDADVVFVGHVGVPHGFGEVWRELPAPQRVVLRLWVVRAADVPADRGDQIDWLFEQWRTLDAWVGGRS
jgi:NTE family protein